ncbi:hypothetical protein CK203_050174 [Vitis vinifera]|uniref:Uncharacterized protein n=1 Tax=Vitis vinifera TaxID=29760 RepID=A0A438G0E9_VITVI|nr:hypothetical protein CK203_050174 [Vitis vinifera]
MEGDAMLQLPQILWAGSCTLFLSREVVKRNGACRCHTCCVCELLTNGFFGFLTEAGTTLEKRIILMTRLYTR